MTDQERIDNLYRENHELREHLKVCREANVALGHDNRNLDRENLELKAKIKELELIPHTDNSDVIYELQNKVKELKDQINGLEKHRAFIESDDRELTRMVSERNARIKELEASQSNWISVKDRLPKEDDKWTGFLVTNGTDCAVCVWRGYWNDDPFCGDALCNITHWMPLPPPPTEENTTTEKEGK